MKQVHPNYTFVASTKTITLTGLNISQDQLLLITNATRGVIYYNFASSSHRAIVTAGANTTVVLTDASTTGHADSDQLVVHYDDQLFTQTIAGTVTANLNANSFVAAITENNANGEQFAVQVGNSSGVINSSNPLAISGTVTANATLAQDVIEYFDESGASYAVAVHIKDAGNNIIGSGGVIPISGTVTVGNSVTIGSLPAISGTVSTSISTGSFANAGAQSSAINCSGYDYLVQHITGGGGGCNRPIQWSNDNTNWFSGGSIFKYNTPGGSTTTGTNAHWENLGDVLGTTSGLFVIPVVGRYWRIGSGTGGGGSWTHYWYLHKGPFPGILEEAIGPRNASPASTDTGDGGLISLFKRLLQRITTLVPANLTVSSTRLLVDGSGVTQPVSGTVGISGTVPVSGTFWQATQPVSGTITAAQTTAANLNATVIGSGSFTAAQATAANLNATVVQGTATNLKTQAEVYQGGTAVGSGSPLQVTLANTGANSTAILTTNRGATGEATVSNFTSTTSATLKSSNSNRKVLTIYNEGAGNLHVLYGSGTASTTNYSVKLFTGDYLEIDKYTGQVNAIFATAGTARVTEIT